MTGDTRAAMAGMFQTPGPTTPANSYQYPGMYFPPTDSSEANNPLKNYDFIIGKNDLQDSHFILIFRR